MAKGQLDSRFLGESDFERWDRFVSSAPTGSIYSTSTYDDFIGGVARYEEKSFKGTTQHGN